MLRSLFAISHLVLLSHVALGARPITPRTLTGLVQAPYYAKEIGIPDKEFTELRLKAGRIYSNVMERRRDEIRDATKAMRRNRNDPKRHAESAERRHELFWNAYVEVRKDLFKLLNARQEKRLVQLAVQVFLLRGDYEAAVEVFRNKRLSPRERVLLKSAKDAEPISERLANIAWRVRVAQFAAVVGKKTISDAAGDYYSTPLAQLDAEEKWQIELHGIRFL